MEAENNMKLLEKSHFFENGKYHKASSCSKIYKIAKDGDAVCGVPIHEDEIGSSKFDALSSLQNCIDDDKEYIVDTKFNGHRAIVEYRDGKVGAFSKKKRNDKPFPMATVSLLRKYIDGELDSKPNTDINDVILDGEFFLRRCNVDGKEIIPEIGMQGKAIKGDHLDLYRDCEFAFQIFDIIRLNGEDISDKSLKERRELLQEVFPEEVSSKINKLIEVMDKKGDKIETNENVFLTPVLGDYIKGIDKINDKYCRVTRKGQEGLVIKDPDSVYKWRGRSRSSRKGWTKLKEQFDVDLSVTKACLGNWYSSTASNRNLSRYSQLEGSVCKDKECNELITVGKVSSLADGSPIEGMDGWDEHIHYPLLEMLRKGIVIPFPDAQYRKLSDIEDGIISGDLRELTDLEISIRQMGCEHNDGCLIDKDGDIALPECIRIPDNKFIIESVTTEINMNDNHPHLGGPPRLVRVRNEKMFPNDIVYLNDLYARESNFN
jgi:hypothetical protein